MQYWEAILGSNTGKQHLANYREAIQGSTTTFQEGPPPLRRQYWEEKILRSNTGKQDYFSGRASATQEAILGNKILGSNTGEQHYFSGRASPTQLAILGSKILPSNTGKQNYFSSWHVQLDHSMVCRMCFT